MSHYPNQCQGKDKQVLKRKVTEKENHPSLESKLSRSTTTSQITVQRTLATRSQSESAVNMNLPLLPHINYPLTEEDAERINGRQRGVQGHRNSCYLDATLFSMFSFSSVFDEILIPEPDGHNQEGYDEDLALDVKNILRDGIVNPLRKHLFASSDKVMLLREKMLHLDKKLTTEEMDPEEYLQLLFHDVLHMDEFISLSSGLSDYFYQVLVPNSDNDCNTIPTLQQLLEKSLIMQQLKFKKIPGPSLMLLMPRSGNQYKTYYGVLPNLTIDITDVMENTPRSCIICGALATQECTVCFGKFPGYQRAGDKEVKSGADSTAFCFECVTSVHNRSDRAAHKESIEKINISISSDNLFRTNLVNSNRNMNGGLFSSTFFTRSLPWTFNSNTAHQATSKRIPRVTMDLFAVICIETSHFVSFVKCGTERLAPWVFFDSMADRVENMDGTGHNIPHVKLLPKMGIWLNRLESQPQELIKESMGNMTVELRRLLTDPYICFYRSPQVSMYS